ncbi:MAG: Fe-S cluster assembly protein SufD [Calditrichia bacterium]
MNTIQNTETITRYIVDFEEFEKHLNGQAGISFHQIRQSALERFKELGFPHSRMEAWKYTNLAPLLKQKFDWQIPEISISEEKLKPFRIKGLDQVLVFINGRFSEKFSQIHPAAPGVIIESLDTALISHTGLIESHLSKYAEFQDNAFTALNTAFTRDGVFLYLPDNTVLDKSVHILNLINAPQGAFHTHPRLLLITGKNCEMDLVESHHALTENTYFHNRVVEIDVRENSHIQHIKIQDESKAAFGITNSYVKQERDSSYTSVHIDVGGALIRNNLNIRLNGENGQASLYGFYLGSGEQHIDNSTFLDHAKPHCNSNELFKGILTDRAKGIFSGTILVRQEAQKTNAFQSNKTLLLSEEAEIDSRPQLKIFADDVRCTHGATIGQLDEQALFYLRQRGIREEDAQNMLRFAFAAEVLEKIKDEKIQKHIGHFINRRLKKELSLKQK